MMEHRAIAVGLAVLLVVSGCATTTESPTTSVDESTTTYPDPVYEQDYTKPEKPATKSEYGAGLNVTRIEQLVGQKINQHREANNLSRLHYDPKVGNIARYHSWEMEEHGYFAHESAVDGDDHNNWLRQYNYSSPGLDAENIASTVVDDWRMERNDTGAYLAKEIFTLWKTSESHNEAMLGPYAIQGVGVYIGEDGTLYATLFLLSNEPA
ncbi:CAP domain-containing protein [Halobacterium rubrum]|uniref:CAP domain-containing protein n=1 Tax=Halobacterium TaxID=2239 RepID=UPI001F44DA1B|nr:MULTISPECIES: CAP domain-containing protein [Halobacterium]MDH5021703.1 CAP domain-containing protein [Halobacterium rubrum]